MSLTSDTSLDRVTVKPLTTRIGAEVLGVDLRDEIDEATVGAILSALVEWAVLFFRDQALD